MQVKDRLSYQALERFVLAQKPDLWLPMRYMSGVAFITRDAYGHAGTKVGAVPTTNGYYFDGSNDRLVITCPKLNYTSGDFSIMARINPSNLTGYHDPIIRGLESGPAQGEGWEMRIRDSVGVRFDTFQNNAIQTSNGGANILSVGKGWTVGIDRIGASVRCIINGRDVTSTAGTHIDPTTSARTAKIGIREDETSYPFAGLLVDLVVYGQAMGQLSHLAYHELMEEIA